MKKITGLLINSRTSLRPVNTNQYINIELTIISKIILYRVGLKKFINQTTNLNFNKTNWTNETNKIRSIPLSKTLRSPRVELGLRVCRWRIQTLPKW